MADEPQAANTLVNGTAPHAQLPNAPSWFGAALANPAQTIALVGVLLLGGVQGLDAIRSTDPAPVDVDAEIARREAAEDQAEQVKQAADNARACLTAIQDLEDKLDKSVQDAQSRSDEQLAFTGEIAQYLQRLAEKLTKDQPETGPRLDEYIRKALMRGYRTQEDR